MITLTPKQEEVLLTVSEQEGRHPSQRLSLLMDSGVDLFYCSRESLFTSKRGEYSDIKSTGLWDEAQDFHKREYNGYMLPLGEEVYASLPEYEDHPSEYYDKLLDLCDERGRPL